MYNLIQYLAVTTVLMSFAAQVVFATETLKFETEDDKISYSIGYNLGDEYGRRLVKLNTEAVMRGIEDGVSQSDPLISHAEMERMLTIVAQKVAAIRQEHKELRARKAAGAGKRYREQNAKKEGVAVTESGLQYQILKEGEGAHPGPLDKVKVHYRGTLVDGTEFDNSYSRGEPASFPLNRVIRGWQEGLQLMRPGAKCMLVIPPELAYGSRATGSIPPNSTLVFEIELLSVEQRE